MRRWLGLFLFLAAVVPSAAGAQPLDAALDRLGSDLRRDVLVPAHEAFAEATQALADEAVAYCAMPDAARLDTLRQAFHTAADRWMAIQWIGFGPEAFEMRRTRLQFWPDTRNVVGRQLADALASERADLLDPAALAEASVALQGLPALERLLFEETRIEEGTYACALTVAIARNIAGMADDLHRSWQTPEAAAVPVAEGRALVAEIYRSVFEHLTAVVDRKLHAVAGKSPADARPRLAESWRSQRSLRNIRHNLQGIAAVVGDSGTGLAAVLRDAAGGPDTAERLREQIDRAMALSGRLQGQPMAAVVVEGPQRDDLDALIVTLAELRHLWENAVGEALGLRVGFNSMDGD
jgi:predicted lipoprotein